MTDYTDYEGVLAAIKTGIDSARRIKEREVSCADENFTLVTDDFIALNRAGSAGGIGL